MDLINAQNRLALRLYEWSLRDLIREMREGCPLMSLVGLNNRYVAAFVVWVKTLTLFEQEKLAKMLVRRAHENAAQLCGESLSVLEQKQFNLELFQQVSNCEHSLAPLASALNNPPLARPVNSAHCIDSLFASLGQSLGKPKRRKLGVTTTRIFGDWRLITEFTFYKPDKYLFCEHQFVRKDAHPVIGHTSPYPRNLFMLYGITNTKAVVLSEEDGESMAKILVKLAEHFVTQAEPLFFGLGINDLNSIRQP